MQYVCLRNCVVNDVLWKEGKIYNLPDSMDKHPRNFRLVGEPAPEPLQSTTEPIGDNTCQCGRECKNLAGLKAHQRGHRKD
ncbi:hypothetical protein LCGC14_2154910 [marine sediment metagenome]|uniref:Uncharacterized protein n=1 Tax=marine sediment metagenome TaxID=412755 RepID=A0A0F9G7H9_9ZZZZ